MESDYSIGAIVVEQLPFDSHNQTYCESCRSTFCTACDQWGRLIYHSKAQDKDDYLCIGCMKTLLQSAARYIRGQISDVA